MSELLAYWNGRFVPASSIAIPLDDIGFAWGATVVERLRTYRGTLFRLADHVTRFRKSCDSCRIPQAITDAEIASIAERLIEQNQPIVGGELVLIIFATPGNGHGEPTLCLHTVPFSGEPYAALLEIGANLITPSVRHFPPECLPRSAKMRSRLFWWIAEQEVRENDPRAQALLLDQNGFVVETSNANVAIIKNGTLLTPPRSTVLDGVSLRVVEELCGELEIPFEETPLRPDECFSADEAILTSTPFGVAGVSSINGHAIPSRGPILWQLHDAWSRMVGCPIW